MEPPTKKIKPSSEDKHPVMLVNELHGPGVSCYAIVTLLYVRGLKISNLCFSAGLQFGWRGGSSSEHGVHLQRRGDGSHWQGNNLRRNGKKQEGRQEGLRHGSPHESLQLHPPRYT